MDDIDRIDPCRRSRCEVYCETFWSHLYTRIEVEGRREDGAAACLGSYIFYTVGRIDAEVGGHRVSYLCDIRAEIDGDGDVFGVSSEDEIGWTHSADDRTTLIYERCRHGCLRCHAGRGNNTTDIYGVGIALYER